MVTPERLPVVLPDPPTISPSPVASVKPAGAVETSPPVADQTPAATASKSASSTIVIEKNAVIGIRLDQAIAAETARVDDKISARVARDVVVDGMTAIAAGTRLEGVVTLVDRGERSGSRLAARFTTPVRADSMRVPIQTDTIRVKASPPANRARPSA
jgi:hypothetical protein